MAARTSSCFGSAPSSATRASLTLVQVLGYAIDDEVAAAATVYYTVIEMSNGTSVTSVRSGSARRASAPA